MKKFLSTLAFVLAVSSVSMAKSSHKKVNSQKLKISISNKVAVLAPQCFCDSQSGACTGVVFSNGETEGYTGCGSCPCQCCKND